MQAGSSAGERVEAKLQRRLKGPWYQCKTRWYDSTAVENALIRVYSSGKNGGKDSDTSLSVAAVLVEAVSQAEASWSYQPQSVVFSTQYKYKYDTVQIQIQKRLRISVDRTSLNWYCVVEYGMLLIKRASIDNTNRIEHQSRVEICGCWLIIWAAIDVL